MGLEARVVELHKRDKSYDAWAISLHAFSDLSHVSPVVFLYLLKECYAYGTRKATAKFGSLRQQVHQVLSNAPRPGPAVFIARCLYILPMLESYCEGLSHLILSALARFLKIGTTPEDLLEAKIVSVQLFLDFVGGRILHDERILIKILKVFDVGLIDIKKVICNSDVKNDCGLNTAKAFVEHYIFELLESQSYMTAVTLLEHFSIRQSGESLILKMMENKQYIAAEKWATFMGKPMLRVLVQEYINANLLKHAYVIIKENNLRQEFPEVYHKCKESSLKTLAEKGCWDIAEARTNKDRQLLEYLVYLAMEAGYSEKVDELCDRYSLKGFMNDKEPDARLVQSRYLCLHELVMEDIIWVDEVNGLREATDHIEGCKVVGIDCEWKPNYEKGSKPNKVSIMQIASEKMVYIFDLIKLFQDAPDVLDDCLTRIFHSPRILKLGYNFQCDVNQLAHSFGEVGFKHYEMLLDIQNVFGEPRGGLSGLAKKILGAGLNKTRRNSNWEQRPLSQNQLEYAALDAVVLVHIFRHVRSNSQLACASNGQTKIEWKSYIVSHMDNPSKTKKKPTSKMESDAEIYDDLQPT